MAGMGQKWATLDSEAKGQRFESSTARHKIRGLGESSGFFIWTT